MTIYEKQGRRYIPRPDLTWTQHIDPHALIVGATRYYLGRRTIAAACFAQYELAKAWNELPIGTRSVIKADIEDAFTRDDEARERGENYRPLGDDCDRAAWAVLRQKWAGQDAPLTEHIPTKKDLAQRLRLLSAEMQHMGEVMQTFGGHIADHGAEMNGAGHIAEGWADGIEEELSQ